LKVPVVDDRRFSLSIEHNTNRRILPSMATQMWHQTRNLPALFKVGKL